LSQAFDSRVRLALYRDFVAAGRAPSAAQLSHRLQSPEIEVRAALERLATEKAIVLQPESREILMAPPLSAVPTPFVVHAGSRSCFAPCIWDGLGAMALLGEAARLETSCGCCGEAMTLELRGGKPAGARGTIHFAIPARQWWNSIVFT
jgi:hypothetical protein